MGRKTYMSIYFFSLIDYALNHHHAISYYSSVAAVFFKKAAIIIAIYMVTKNYIDN